MVLILTTLLPTASRADAVVVGVGVKYVDLLDAPDSVRAVVSRTDGDDAVKVAIQESSPFLIRYSHNSSNAKMITVTAIPETGNDANITLRLAVEGEPEVVLVDAGKPLSNVAVWKDIAAGGYTRSITWIAECAGVVEPSPEPIVWNVVFTSCDTQ